MNKAIGSLKTNNSLKTRFFSVVFVKDEKKKAVSFDTAFFGD